MPHGAIVEADVAKPETTQQLLFEIELVVVGEVETVFSSHHDVIGADGAHENSDDVEISIHFCNIRRAPMHTVSTDLLKPQQKESE